MWVIASIMSPLNLCLFPAEAWWVRQMTVDQGKCNQVVALTAAAVLHVMSLLLEINTESGNVA